MPAIPFLCFSYTATFCKPLARHGTRFQRMTKINSGMGTALDIIVKKSHFPGLCNPEVCFVLWFQSSPYPIPGLKHHALTLIDLLIRPFICQTLTERACVSGRALGIGDKSENQKGQPLPSWHLQSTWGLALTSASEVLIPCIAHVVIAVLGSKSPQNLVA